MISHVSWLRIDPCTPYKNVAKEKKKVIMKMACYMLHPRNEALILGRCGDLCKHMLSIKNLVVLLHGQILMRACIFHFIGFGSISMHGPMLLMKDKAYHLLKNITTIWLVMVNLFKGNASNSAI